jgi:hypothetical protein
MLALGYALAAVILSCGVLALALRRRSARSVDPLPPGLRNIATQVGTLSNLGVGLRIEPGARRRIVTPIGVR